MAKILATAPAPDRLYRIRKGDSFLPVAGETYSVGAGGERMQRAQLVNWHPFNWRYHVTPTTTFNKQFFLGGIVTFMPKFSCSDADFNDPLELAPGGRCFGIVFLPPESDIWMRPPPEVVQPDALTCWAAAIFSWSQVAPGAKRFTSVDDVIDAFRDVSVEIPLETATITRKIVNASGGLVRWPKEEVDFERADGTRIRISPGMLTLEKVVHALDVSMERADSSLTLREVIAVLKKSDGPVLVLKTAPGEVGHAVVIFGGSEQDGFVGEMNPLLTPGRPTGPALGPLKTRWLPTFKAFAERKTHAGVEEPWEEFVFLFKRK